MNSYDEYCLDCGGTLPVNCNPQRELCDNCKRSRKLNRDNLRYYRKRLHDTYQTWKVLMLQSPYFAEKRRIEKPVMV